MPQQFRRPDNLRAQETARHPTNRQLSLQVRLALQQSLCLLNWASALVLGINALLVLKTQLTMLQQPTDVFHYLDMCFATHASMAATPASSNDTTSCTQTLPLIGPPERLYCSVSVLASGSHWKG